MIANLRVFQRVLRVAPNTDAAQALLGIGIQIGNADRHHRPAAVLHQSDRRRVDQERSQRRSIMPAAQRYANVVSLYMKLNFNATGRSGQAWWGT